MVCRYYYDLAPDEGGGSVCKHEDMICPIYGVPCDEISTWQCINANDSDNDEAYEAWKDSQ